VPVVALAPALDDLDRAVIARLREDGRASNRSLAEALGVNEATIGSRLRRLEDEHVVRVVAVTDMEALGHEFLAIGKVRVAGRPVREVGAELAEMPENIAVVLTMGQYDLFLSILARDRHHLSELLTDTLPGVKGVESLRCELALEVLQFKTEWGVLGTEDRPEEPRGPSDAVDELDLQIIDLLQHDARSSNRRIAAQLGVSEGTVRARIRRMEDEKVIRITGIAHPAAFGMGISAYVGFDIDGGRTHRVAQRLLQLEQVSMVMTSLGDYDLLAVVVAPSREALVDFVLDELGAIPGVRRTETTESLGVLKHSYTWTRLV
jgi:DNA-binding Lrp family transcriptional regulator